jgi:hypothetical protein
MCRADVAIKTDRNRRFVSPRPERYDGGVSNSELARRTWSGGMPLR